MHVQQLNDTSAMRPACAPLKNNVISVYNISLSWHFVNKIIVDLETIMITDIFLQSPWQYVQF